MGTEAKNPTVLKSRKRKRQPELWKKNIKKKAINSGEEYSYKLRNTDGKEVPKTIKKIQMKPPCKENCRLKCQDSFPEEERQKIFTEFYATGDKMMQSPQIASLVSKQPKIRTRKRRDKAKIRNREFTRVYTLLTNGNPIQVCQQMFLNTLAIDEKRVRTVLKNVTATGAPTGDRRGRHGQHKTSQEREKFVMEHIQQFKVVESHYVP